MSTADRQRLAADSWAQFCDRLKDAGAQLLRVDFPIAELDLTEGLKYLAHLAYASIQRNLDGADPANPLIYLLCDERIKSGGDNPDNRYYVAAVSHQYDYLLTCDFSNCTYYSVVALGRKEMTSGRSAAERAGRPMPPRLDKQTLEAEPDGSICIYLSEAPRAPNYLPIDERTNLLIVRCTVEKTLERPISVSLRRTDERGAGPALSLEGMREKLDAVADHVVKTSSFFADWTAKFQQHLNELPFADQAYIHSTGGDPNILYYLSAWSVDREEALVIHIAEIPECIAWNFQLCNVWFESLDYTQARIHVNGANAARDKDSGVTLIVCERDPGHPNWLSTTGHTSGAMCMRFTGAVRPAKASTALIRWQDAGKLIERVA
jgi:hypothetical protein